jgi:hypothetical protein
MAHSDNDDFSDQFSISRIKKLKLLVANLPKRKYAQSEDAFGDKEFLLLFQFIDKRVNKLADLLEPYVSMTISRNFFWTAISCQGETNDWWATYIICLKKSGDSSGPKLSFTLIIPNSITGVPTATTLVIDRIRGVKEFYAWNPLQHICQSIALILRSRAK